MYDHRAVTLICFECDQDFSNGSGCTQHGNLVGETDTSERRPAIARRFPVRGLDASHDRGASLKRLGRCLRRFLSPCSNRGTDKSEGRHPPPCLRPLFAQGDPRQGAELRDQVPSTPVRTGRPLRQEEGGVIMPSTPVRTGRPMLELCIDPTLPFDPCSHREARRGEVSQGPRSLQPLFAQGDPRQERVVRRHPPSTPVRTGRPEA